MYYISIILTIILSAIDSYIVRYSQVIKSYSITDWTLVLSLFAGIQ